jgi:Lecithin retinol acyltransferase
MSLSDAGRRTLSAWDTRRHYVGFGRVVQYGGFARGLQRGPVEEVPLTQFTRGYPLWVRSEESACFDGEEIARRARSRVGEDRYNLLTNNCEHFCQWCVRAEHRSDQVDRWLSHLRRALRMPIRLIAKLLTIPEAHEA